jgi:hypothetical protein
MDKTKIYNISFLTICFNNFEKLSQTYYENVKKYREYPNIEFILVMTPCEDKDKLEEYLFTNLFYELKNNKLRCYNYTKDKDVIDLDEIKKEAVFLASYKNIHYLDSCELILDNLIDEINYDICENVSIDNYNFEKLDFDNYKILTCFSVVFNSDNFIDNLIRDILSQTIFNNINFIIINMCETNNVITNKKIENLRVYKNITIINETKDYGLYNMWNKCITMSETYFLSNMNPDDIRGSDWAFKQLINFEPNVILVAPKYIPTEKIIYHNELIKEGGSIWFEEKCDILNNKPLFYGNNEYFNSNDMFQYNGNNMFQSYNVANCSPIWKKKQIHENENYFNEDKYGVYADYAVWLEAGSKNFVFKQTDYIVGFYINNNQLHRRQKCDINVFNSLLLKYANDNFKNEFFIYNQNN